MDGTKAEEEQKEKDFSETEYTGYGIDSSWRKEVSTRVPTNKY